MLKELNSIQIELILKKDKCTGKKFIGVFSRDNLPMILKFPSCFILNTDKGSGPGEHWLAFYFDKNRNCEFFDPYGFSPHFYKLENYINSISNRSIWNKKQYQSFSSKACGYFCFIFLLFRCRGISFRKINLNDKKLKKIFN